MPLEAQLAGAVIAVVALVVVLAADVREHAAPVLAQIGRAEIGVVAVLVDLAARLLPDERAVAPGVRTRALRARVPVVAVRGLEATARHPGGRTDPDPQDARNTVVFRAGVVVEARRAAGAAARDLVIEAAAVDAEEGGAQVGGRRAVRVDGAALAGRVGVATKTLVAAGAGEGRPGARAVEVGRTRAGGAGARQREIVDEDPLGRPGGRLPGLEEPAQVHRLAGERRQVDPDVEPLSKRRVLAPLPGRAPAEGVGRDLEREGVHRRDRRPDIEIGPEGEAQRDAARQLEADRPRRPLVRAALAGVVAVLDVAVVERRRRAATALAAAERPASPRIAVLEAPGVRHPLGEVEAPEIGHAAALVAAAGVDAGAVRRAGARRTRLAVVAVGVLGAADPQRVAAPLLAADPGEAGVVRGAVLVGRAAALRARGLHLAAALRAGAHRTGVAVVAFGVRSAALVGRAAAERRDEALLTDVVATAAGQETRFLARRAVGVLAAFEQRRDAARVEPEARHHVTARRAPAGLEHPAGPGARGLLGREGPGEDLFVPAGAHVQRVARRPGPTVRQEGDEDRVGTSDGFVRGPRGRLGERQGRVGTTDLVRAGVGHARAPDRSEAPYLPAERVEEVQIEIGARVPGEEDLRATVAPVVADDTSAVDATLALAADERTGPAAAVFPAPPLRAIRRADAGAVDAMLTVFAGLGRTPLAAAVPVVVSTDRDAALAASRRPVGLAGVRAEIGLVARDIDDVGPAGREIDGRHVDAGDVERRGVRTARAAGVGRRGAARRGATEPECRHEREEEERPPDHLDASTR